MIADVPHEVSTVEPRSYHNFALFVRQTGERKSQACAKEIFHQPQTEICTFSYAVSAAVVRDRCARFRFHQIQGPVTASAATARLKMEAKMRVGQPKMSPVWISLFHKRAYFSATGMARVYRTEAHHQCSDSKSHAFFRRGPQGIP